MIKHPTWFYLLQTRLNNSGGSIAFFPKSMPFSLSFTRETEEICPTYLMVIFADLLDPATPSIFTCHYGIPRGGSSQNLPRKQTLALNHLPLTQA